MGTRPARTTLSQDWSETEDGKTVVMLSTRPIYHTKLDFFSLYSIAGLAIPRGEKRDKRTSPRNIAVIIPYLCHGKKRRISFENLGLSICCNALAIQNNTKHRVMSVTFNITT